MDVRQAIEDARTGALRPVYLIVGTETLLIERAVDRLRRAVADGGIAGFNEDLFHGSTKVAAAKVVAAAETLPMMASKRFVLLRRVDLLDLDQQAVLAPYIAKASPTTVLVMTAEKVAGNTKLGRAAASAKAVFDAKPLKGPALREHVAQEARDRGHPISSGATEALLDAFADDLAALDDALERLSLFVGPGQRIDDAAIEACVSKLKVDSIWALVDAVSLRDARKATAAASSLLLDREPALRILAMLARQLRMVARVRDAIVSGMSDEDAARAAGAPPFKARELRAAAKRFTMTELTRAFSLIAETDLLLKGSKIPDDVVLERAVLALCTPR
ncbi:MAG: DNA polymerase III subunit delta [Myxococcales bacterium]|nr:DNA polymerase III subunit delta [Myxococcales bacterium]